MTSLLATPSSPGTLPSLPESLWSHLHPLHPFPNYSSPSDLFLLPDHKTHAQYAGLTEGAQTYAFPGTVTVRHSWVPHFLTKPYPSIF